MFFSLLKTNFFFFVSEWIIDSSSERAQLLLRTQYHAVTQNLGNPLATKW